MAENQFPSTVDALLKGMDNFITTKTVVGEPLKVEDAVIIPLMDVSCGMGAGSYVQNSKANTGGGMGARMSPSAILVIQNGMTRLVNIRHQDAMTKALDMVPDLVNRFVGGKDISPEAMEKAEDTRRKASRKSPPVGAPPPGVFHRNTWFFPMAMIWYAISS